MSPAHYRHWRRHNDRLLRRLDLPKRSSDLDQRCSRSESLAIAALALLAAGVVAWAYFGGGM